MRSYLTPYDLLQIESACLEKSQGLDAIKAGAGSDLACLAKVIAGIRADIDTEGEIHIQEDALSRIERGRMQLEYLEKAIAEEHERIKTGHKLALEHEGRDEGMARFYSDGVNQAYDAIDRHEQDRKKASDMIRQAKAEIEREGRDA